MQIERHLKRLLSKENFKDTSKIPPSLEIAAPRKATTKAKSSIDGSLAENGLVRTSGNAGLESGNNFNGQPQAFMELRAPAESHIHHGAVKGAFPIYIPAGGNQAWRPVGAGPYVFMSGYHSADMGVSWFADPADGIGGIGSNSAGAMSVPYAFRLTPSEIASAVAL